MKKKINNSIQQKIKEIIKKNDISERAEVVSDNFFKIFLAAKLNLLFNGESVFVNSLL